MPEVMLPQASCSGLFLQVKPARVCGLAAELSRNSTELIVTATVVAIVIEAVRVQELKGFWLKS